MLDIKYVTQNLQEVQKLLSTRGETVDLEPLNILNQQRKKNLLELEDLRHRRNVVTQEIALIKKAGEDAEKLVAEMRTVSSRVKDLAGFLSEIEEKIKTIVMALPNLPHSSVPTGTDSSQNPVRYIKGNLPDFDFEPLPHWTLGEKLGILDFNRASKITGTRFPLYFGLAAKLERALINFMLDLHTQQYGYKEVLPPFIVNSSSMR
nr:serine--tRNA ligase [Desulfobacterales bacterium]